MRLLHIACTAEITSWQPTLLLHMNLKTHSTSIPSQKAALKLKAYVKTHADLFTPHGAGHYVGQK